MAKKEPEETKSAFEHVKDAILYIPQLISQEIWRTTTLNEHSLKARCFAILRIIAITCNGISQNRIASHAAALSYYTLIALGPMIAIVIMISGFIVRDNQESVTVNSLTQLIYFIAPSTEQASDRELDSFFDDIDDNYNSNLVKDSSDVSNVNPKLVDFIKSVVDNARSGTVLP